MIKQRIITVCDRVIETCFLALIAAVTFSTSLVEIASSLLIISWITKKVIEKDLSWLKLGPIRITLVLWAWVILSCFNSEYPSESFRGIFKVLEYSLVFIAVATTAWKKGFIKRFIYVLTGTTIVISANGFFQYFTGEGLIRHRTLITLDYMRRTSSSFIHPNDFGVYLLVVCAIFLSFVISEREKIRSKMLFFIPMIISLLSLFFTKSRGAWLSFCAAFLVTGALRSKRMVAFFLALLLSVFVLLPYTAQERIFSLTDTKSGTTWERLMLWKGTINMIKEHPILGFGVNTYSRNFPKYKPGEYPDVRYSHNCYLHMASEIGIPGALIFLVFLISTLICVIKGVSSMPPGRAKILSLGIFTGLVGFSINAMVDTHFYSVNLAVFFHLFLGFCYALACNEEKKHA
ncbi:MAG: O-antigen ligase family protein [Candidatus Omnitrophota bacterium]